MTDAAHHQVDLVVSDPMAVPEPSSLAVIGLGIVTLLSWVRPGSGSSPSFRHPRRRQGGPWPIRRR